jgi:hypothetical protein
MSLETIAFLVIVLVGWYFIIPAASAQLSKAITQERITDSFRGYIEFRWPGSLLDYLVHCPVCTGYWTSAAICTLASPLWVSVSNSIPCIGGSLSIGFVMWLATVYYTVQKVK